MSKTQRVLELVKEIEGLDAQRAAKMEELQALIGDKQHRQARKAAAPADPTGWPEAIEGYLASHKDRTCQTGEICEAIGCPVHVFTYHVGALIEGKRVKRVKRGHYQLRGRR